MMNTSKLYMTPLGPFRSWKQILDVYDLHPMTLSRRIKSDSPIYRMWFPIKGQISPEVLKVADEIETTLQVTEDTCPHCTAIDDLLFKEQCWLIRTTHDHMFPTPDEDNKELSELNDVTVYYSYAGVDYMVQLNEWLEGVRPHLKEN